MFVKACEDAKEFTRPVVISTRSFQGDVTTGIGAFIVLNQDGWVASAAHIAKGLIQAQTDEPLVRQYDAAVAAIEAGPGTPNQKRTKVRTTLKKDDAWLRNASIWWGEDGAAIAELHVYPSADLLLARLTAMSPTPSGKYPSFKEPAGVHPGTSLVKIGYPFHHLQSTWDKTTGSFKFACGHWPLFPIEGIHTRIADAGISPEGLPIRFLETSSPGLMGQSGGPTMDKDGVVYAIQSQTISLPLGFIPELQIGNKKVKEHQFINIGLGVHTETLKDAFSRHGVSVSWVP